MPVLEQVTDQINDAADKFFDAADSANTRAHKATKTMVSRIEKGDVPFSDRLPEVNLDKLPLIDKLPEPQDAVDAYFGFWSKGIKTNREIHGKIMSRFADETEAAPAKAATVVKTAAKKAAPVKKTAAKKATVKKTAAKKAPAKKTTAKKA